MTKESTADKDRLITLADIVGAHGIRGAVKLIVHTADPQKLFDYSPLQSQDGKKTFTLNDLQPHGRVWLAHFDEIPDRTAAEKLRGTRLCTPRHRLPQLEAPAEYYHVDLIGLRAQTADGREVGRVINVANFGASDLLDIKPAKGPSFYVPFTDAFVPRVDLEEGIVEIMPHGLLD